MHSEMKAKPDRRYQRKWRSILIDPGVQLRYLFWISFTALGLVTLYAVLTYHYIGENMALLVDLSPMSEDAKLQLYGELREIVVKISGVSCLFFLACSAFGLVLSHRTAGPLHHFRKVFIEIRNGNRELRIHLRPRDEFQDVAKEFNAMMDCLTESKQRK